MQFCVDNRKINLLIPSLSLDVKYVSWFIICKNNNRFRLLFSKIEIDNIIVKLKKQLIKYVEFIAHFLS